jgi:uncharacterized membrane protein YcaP (DUF421 family)
VIAFQWPGWNELLIPDQPFLEMFVRGSVIYLVLFILFRSIRRQSGSITVSDLLLLVLVADASQNAMTGDYRSLPNGIVLLGTLFFWDYTINWLSYRFPKMGRFVHPPPFPLIQQGRFMKQNLKREMITEDEIKSHVRAEGIAEIADVEMAYLEGNGQISVVPKKGHAK